MTPAMRPSQHPERKEVLGMMGRNRDKSRVTMLQQFFSHNTGGIIWEEIQVAKFNVPATKGGEYQMTGIIDYLFPPVN